MDGNRKPHEIADLEPPELEVGIAILERSR
jgi:hypothetical protein